MLTIVHSDPEKFSAYEFTAQEAYARSRWRMILDLYRKEIYQHFALLVCIKRKFVYV